MFADGENLVFRYQDMLATGRRPLADVVHVPDCYVWSPRITWDLHHPEFQLVNRAYYYTSIVGDDNRVASVRRAISQIEYLCLPDATSSGVRHHAQLVPMVFKKDAQSRKTRNVDIQIVIVVMRFAHSSQFEQIHILSGDGDYLPLIREVARLGKQVRISAFSSGLNPLLQSDVDRFAMLDNAFFEP